MVEVVGAGGDGPRLIVLPCGGIHLNRDWSSRGRGELSIHGCFTGESLIGSNIGDDVVLVELACAGRTIAGGVRVAGIGIQPSCTLDVGVRREGISSSAATVISIAILVSKKERKFWACL